MILAISRFRIANEMEGEVTEAFLQRPRLVNTVPGLLGRETFTDPNDPSIFFLVTRWTDEGSFQNWHKNPNHDAAHRFIPQGLKLESSFTLVTLMDRLPGAADQTLMETSVMDAAPFLARFLSSSRSVYFISATREGVVLTASRALSEQLDLPMAELIGNSLWRWITETDAIDLRRRVDSGQRDQPDFLLNFSGADHLPFTLDCRLDIYPDGFVLIGEFPLARDLSLPAKLVESNNEMAVLARESARQNKALARVRADLEKSYDELKNSNWQLRKIQELLPICMECGKVKTGEATWDDLATFVKENSEFLTHCYCPDCAAQLARQWGLKGS